MALVDTGLCVRASDVTGHHVSARHVWVRQFDGASLMYSAYVVEGALVYRLVFMACCHLSIRQFTVSWFG